MKIFRNHRQFDSLADAEAYSYGYRSYPRWPHVGINGSREAVDHDTFEAMGYYDAEREFEEKQDRAYEQEAMRADWEGD